MSTDADKLRRLREGLDKWGWCAEFGALAAEVLREGPTGGRHALQAQGKHPAPCARHCEATAFSIEIRQLKAENERLRAAAAAPQGQAEPVAGVPEALAKWARQIDLAGTDWQRGYEAARGWVKVQLEFGAPAQPTPAPWQDRMQAHYAQGNVRAYQASDFMRQELAEWRAGAKVVDARDGVRLDWLEAMANEPGGLLLHDGGDFTGRTGLGLRRIGRTLRQAIDAAMKPKEA